MITQELLLTSMPGFLNYSSHSERILSISFFNHGIIYFIINIYSDD